jgi:IclR family pca regulon transcriptional regulator
MPSETKTESETRMSPAQRLDGWNGDPSFMLSLARGLLVLRAVAEAGGDALSNRALCDKTGLSRAALRRCLYTLETLGYASVVNGAVLAGPEMGSIATAYASSNPLLHAYQPIIRDLSRRTGQSVSYGVFEHDTPRPVDIAYCDHPVQLGVTRRDKIPIHCSSIGRVMLAAMSDGEALQRLRSEDVVRRTGRTLVALPEIVAKVAEARRLGYALVDQEAQPDLRSVAVGVENSRGQTVGWMNITVLTSMLTLRDMRARIAPEMRNAAEELSRQLP